MQVIVGWPPFSSLLFSNLQGNFTKMQGEPAPGHIQKSLCCKELEGLLPKAKSRETLRALQGGAGLKRHQSSPFLPNVCRQRAADLVDGYPSILYPATWTSMLLFVATERACLRIT